ncbi:hypothetical protein LCGC14_1545220 [marine sediment metagenome]|uniref:Uncharacterized protein n=1 Tax=marine sediment metagenome TaxID=412755 RepID=A0A0F9L813_9ZZZZ
MTESENIERVVRALEKVPPKSLLIIEMVNRFMKDGQLDNDALAEAQPEVNVAVAEAKMYGAHTLRAVSTLEQLEAIPDVGSRSNSPTE